MWCFYFVLLVMPWYVKKLLLNWFLKIHTATTKENEIWTTCDDDWWGTYHYNTIRTKCINSLIIAYNIRKMSASPCCCILHLRILAYVYFLIFTLKEPPICLGIVSGTIAILAWLVLSITNMDKWCAEHFNGYSSTKILQCSVLFVYLCIHWNWCWYAVSVLSVVLQIL